MIKELLKKRILVIDGAMGTQLQAKAKEIPPKAWEGKEGCNELLNRTAPEIIKSIHEAYAKVGADIIKTNTFGSMPWVLEEYDLASEAYDLTKRGCELVKEICQKYSTSEKPRFTACSLGPGTKLPSLGHIDYDAMYAGYCEAARGAKDGGADLFLLETCQDPLQIKAAIHACQDTAPEIPVMVSVTIEQNGTMLIGTDAATIATILEPFDIISLGFNCGTGPDMVEKHVRVLSEVWDRPISIHANAGLPQNRGGYTYYPMGPKEFTELEAKFTSIDGVALLGGCCGTTPQHIKALVDAVEGKKPLPPKGKQPRSIASLFESRTLHQNPPPFLMGERSNATGSKAFRELLLKSDYEGTLSVAQQQVRSGAHGIDVSVGFAGRDETKDMKEVIKLYNEKIPIPLMPDSTQVPAIETALKHIGGRPIINSANLEDGIEKFDKICSLAKRYGAALVLLAIDEEGMAKTKEKKLAVAERMYERAVNLHGLNPGDLVFDLLTFTVGSGDEEYQTAAIETIEAIRELRKRHPEVGAVLGVSNISFGLEKHAREYLNSVFLHHCVEAGLTMAIVNVKNLIPYHKISEEDRKVCEDLLFNRRENGDPLFAFIEHFSKAEKKEAASDDELSKLPLQEQIHKLLIDGDKERMMPLLEKAKDRINPEKIINEILIGAMKEVGDLFGSGQMQLPFVLQSAEVMKAAVDYLNQFLPKKEKQLQTTLILGTVKGDVHDVGKNLVDILLTNNGFKVVNLGIKVELEEFIKAYKEHNAQAIGMSGLLVKSTQVMLENLKEMKQKGIDTPVLLGGAALTKKFVDEFCRPAYDGPIFYCRDAFDGIVAMSRIEEGNFDTKLGSDKDEEEIVEVKPKEEIKIDPANIILPKPAPVPIPPFWGRKILEIDPDIAYEWINKRLLFKQRWGYKSKGLSKEEYQKQLDEKVIPAFNRLRSELKDIFEPTILYGYWPARAVDNELYVFGEEFGWQRDEDANREPIENIIGDAIEIFTFPRQSKPPHRCIADYFHSDRMDVSAFTCVSAGSKFSEYEGELFKAGKYHEYHLVHGLSVELAEALAEIAHKQIRIELGILRNEKPDLRDVKMVGYQGARYSPGYPACPDLELNRHIFNLLKPEEFGIELSETYQIHPEQSTCAIVVHHPEAKYFNV
ncbi:methionine synthase [Nitratiruptor sp. YY09-18]|uniref:methionine synthase n=1 Tax=Nitratiruptor sp. YY09-18 TaxID=2724901 RepID=UPI0019160251|nr:methionine synthase [Nitratiruptor sp. YY09-18]BCD68448.1 5-methyltetrahydrofolate--homocysteine methyltransferase [Nitratiruptor sp. YY09-18]